MKYTSLKDFSRFLVPYKKAILWILFFQLVVIASSLSIPYFLGNVLHSLEIKTVTVRLLLHYFLIMALMYIVWNVAAAILNIIFEKVNKSVENDIRSFCYKRILNSSMEKMQAKSEGEIITKVIRDTEKVEKAFSNLFDLGNSIMHSLALIVAMFYVNMTLASIVLLMFIIIVVVHRIMEKPLKALFKDYKLSEENLLTALKNQISGFLTIKVFSLEKKSIESLKAKNKVNLDNHIKISTKVSIIKNFNFFLSSIFRISSIIIGGLIYLVQRINIGQIFSVYNYSILLSNELRNIIEIDIVLEDIILSFRRVMEFMEEFDEVPAATEHFLGKVNKVEFRNVSFQYNEKQIFKNLSFKAEKGNIIGIRGQNGSGKTTLMYLLCGFYKAKGIFLNDQPSLGFSERQILERVSFALQNVHLFPASILENLTCFGEVDENVVYKVCKKIGLHDKIIKLTDGYQTIVNEKNLNLSGGEKQLISLARALLKGSDLLILDEINSALDARTEEELMSNILDLFGDRIVLIISHRDKVFQLCDFVINLDDSGAETKQAI